MSWAADQAPEWAGPGPWAPFQIGVGRQLCIACCGAILAGLAVRLAVRAGLAEAAFRAWARYPPARERRALAWTLFAMGAGGGLTSVFLLAQVLGFNLAACPDIVPVIQCAAVLSGGACAWMLASEAGGRSRPGLYTIPTGALGYCAGLLAGTPMYQPGLMDFLHVLRYELGPWGTGVLVAVWGFLAGVALSAAAWARRGRWFASFLGLIAVLGSGAWFRAQLDPLARPLCPVTCRDSVGPWTCVRLDMSLRSLWVFEEFPMNGVEVARAQSWLSVQVLPHPMVEDVCNDLQERALVDADVDLLLWSVRERGRRSWTRPVPESGPPGRVGGRVRLCPSGAVLYLVYPSCTHFVGGMGDFSSFPIRAAPDGSFESDQVPAGEYVPILRLDGIYQDVRVKRGIGRVEVRPDETLNLGIFELEGL
ncbi:MAG: hypothetical protein AB1758_27195 [Candidatus Eremiobacterota bacterium]